MSARLLVTCEHGGNRVPSDYRPLFAGRDALLASHRGWDPGAISVARGLASALGTTLIAATTTRLLVDPNRSPHNPAVFSRLTRALPREERARLLDCYHRAHWDRIRARISASRGATLHVAVHSFTPVRNGVRRTFAVGLLYDPKRLREKSLAIEWQRRLREHLGRTAVRRNAPYRGNADGLTTALRREFSPARYLGLELELNQRTLSSPLQRRALTSLVENTLRAAIACLR